MTTTGAPRDPAPASPLAGRDLPAGEKAGYGAGRPPFPDPAFALASTSPLGTQSEENPSAGASGLLRTVKRRQGVFLFTFALVTGALAINTLRERIFSPVYEGGFMLQISNPFESGGGGGGGTVESIARTKVRNDVPSLIVLMTSPLLLRPVAIKQGVSIPEIAGNLSISPAGEVQEVLKVNLRWRDPGKGRAILTTLSQEYTKFSLIQRQAAVDSGVRFLDEQAPELLRRVERLQNELRTFRERNNFLDPGGMAGSIQGARDGLVSQLRSLQVAQVELQSQLSSVKAGRLQWTPSGSPTAEQLLGRTSLATPGRTASESVGQAAAGSTTPVQQLLQFEQELASARATYREDSPIVLSIKAKRDQLLPLVKNQSLDGIRAQLLANSSQQDEINRQILLLNENFRTSPRKMKEFEDLQQRLSVARDNYASYIRARETFRLERARNTTPWQVIAPPEFADVPVEPNIQRNLLRAMMLGLLAGLGAAILRERTDNVFHTPMEAERELQLPVLGLIPHLPLEPGIEISSSIAKMSANERFAIKESLRSLFTTFRLLRADRNIRLVGVTSSTQGEGKSTSVTIFARTLADLGLRVLIVDSDMRLPMQSRYLGLEQGEGLSNLLSDHSLKTADLIVNVQENLDILPSGQKPPDPAKLLNSSRCQEVIDDIRAIQNYDIVLFDAPPCLMLSDPILLGEKLDGILFLVGLGKVSRDLAPQASRRIKATGVDVLGIICNQVSFPSRLNDYGYEYGYYYHYAYANNYGKPGYGKSSYGPDGLGNYIKRRYQDSPIGQGSDIQSGGRQGVAVKELQDVSRATDDSIGEQSNGRGEENGSRGSQSNLGSYDPSTPPEERGPMGWLRRRLPWGKGGG